MFTKLKTINLIRGYTRKTKKNQMFSVLFDA